MNKKAYEAAERRYKRDGDFAYLVDGLNKTLTFYPVSARALRQAFEYVIADIQMVEMPLEDAAKFKI